LQLVILLYFTTLPRPDILREHTPENIYPLRIADHFFLNDMNIKSGNINQKELLRLFEPVNLTPGL